MTQTPGLLGRGGVCPLFTSETLGWLLCVVPAAMPLVVARLMGHLSARSQKIKTNNSTFELAFKKLEI